MHEGNRVSKGQIFATLRGESFEADWRIEDHVDVEVFHLAVRCHGFAGNSLDDGPRGALELFVAELQSFQERKSDSVSFEQFFRSVRFRFERTRLGGIGLEFQIKSEGMLLEGSATLDDGYLKEFLAELRRGWQERV